MTTTATCANPRDPSALLMAALLPPWREAAPNGVASASSDREEAAVLARAQTGDEAAYRWLLARYRPRALRLAAQILRRTGDAEDAAQEAFVRAFRSLDTLRTDGLFATWLYKIVVRVCLDRRRSSSWSETLATERESVADDVQPDFSGAVQARLAVETLLDSLSPPMRAALVLREVEGLDYDEIARILSIPTGTVRSRLNAARSQVRRLWESSMGEDDR